jgi:hypothetical protein
MLHGFIRGEKLEVQGFIDWKNFGLGATFRINDWMIPGDSRWWNVTITVLFACVTIDWYR